jgi:DNA-binding IclR family transcriptional regulator
VVLDGDQVVIIARSGSRSMLAYGLHLGARLPAHATSTGRVLLAAKTQGRVQRLDEGPRAAAPDRRTPWSTRASSAR